MATEISEVSLITLLAVCVGLFSIQHGITDKQSIINFLISASSSFASPDRLGGLVVKASASGAEDPGFESRLCRDFSGSSHTSDLNIGTPVTTLPGA